MIKTPSISDIKRGLWRRSQALGRSIKSIEQIEPTEDKLKIKINKKYHYYLTKKGSQPWKSERDISVAKNIAQASYYKKVLPHLKIEKAAIDNLLACQSEDILKSYYKEMNPHRQALIKPIDDYIDDDTYAQIWMSKKYTTQPFDKDDDTYHFSKKGLRVRSKSEAMIADMLDDLGIPYRYAPEMTIDGETIYPDFVCLNKRTREVFIWEHNGIMDSLNYLNRFMFKMNLYSNNGMYPGRPLILTWEDKKRPLNNMIIEMTIKEYLI